MAEFLLMCKCGKQEMFQKYVKGCANKKHWVIRCKNCNAYVETNSKEKAIEKWNTWDLFHGHKIHTEVKDGL